MKRGWILVVTALALALAACSGVPSSSAPQTVEALDTGGAPRPTSPQNLGSDQRTIVESFLDENAATTTTHPIAGAYLTDAARNRWSDATATILADDRTIGTYDGRNHTVTVLGRVLGTLSADGIYKPSRLGDGQGGDRQPFVFHLTRLENGQWRIDRLQSGLLLTDDQFRTFYTQQVLYFYNLNEDALVPDLRWSALDDRVQWSLWLLHQLAAGPRPDLADAVSPDTLPANIDVQDINVTLGTPTLIEIPGSSQLDAGVRDRLAAQVSLTLIEALSGREITITDNEVPVVIPRVGGDTFAAADFTASVGPSLPTSEVYYLTSGRVRDDSGHLLGGPLGEGQYFLTSLAIGQPTPGGPKYAAGVTGSGSNEHAYVGTVDGGVRPTSVEGTLSRPAFAPGRAEVWFGVGSKVVRIEADTPPARAVPVPILSGGGRIVALRFSPDGSRIAIVIAGASGGQQLYIGAVIRGAGQVRVGALGEPISPEGVVVTDVAWLDAFKLFAIGYLPGSQDPRTFATGSDGTDWTNSTLGNLPAPGRPDTVTAATASTVWVSANGYVWKLTGTSWVSPGTTGQTPGTAPIYLE
jgi:Lipoprotein LpqB beta-propeller domain